MSIQGSDPLAVGSSSMLAEEAAGSTASVKLVVWDLDGTLWSGTLSEEEVELDQSRIDLVRTLNRRGIVNSICSKNDEADVRARLERAGLWDEFVFASVNWSPKGPRVAQIVEDIQLRPENVLFIDDLALNREEVRASVPGIRVAGPETIDRLLSLPELQGKDDSELSRLRQYRVLEQKHSDRALSTTTNEDFLRSCDIRVGVYPAGDDDVARLFELVNRTNQLNFTKRRPDEREFAAQLKDPGRRSGYVRVRDRYGDYGICGFFSLTREGDALTDFLFSCRILNMGVETWVYEHLGRPALSVVGDVAATLEDPVDWIAADTDGFDLSEESNATADAASTADPATGDGAASVRQERVLMVGGCDLMTTAHFLGGEIETDFHRNGPTGVPIHGEHTDLVRQAARGISADERIVVDRLPILDQEVFDPPVLHDRYDVVVYSLLMDFTQDRYRHRATGLVVPWNQLDVDATDPASWPGIEKRFGNESINGDFLSWFSGEFERIGALTTEQFQDNVRWLAGSIPAGARLVLLNGAEVPVDYPGEPQRHLRHEAMNAALSQVVDDLPNTTVCDVRPFVVSGDDLSRDIRHYRRHVYVRIAEEIRRSAAPGIDVLRPKAKGRTRWRVRRAAGRLRRRLRPAGP
jgi:FkbH-like protein